MISGIGPRSTLSAHNIPLIAHVPGVGQNLLDQPNFGLAYETALATFSTFANPSYLNAANDAFLTSQSGPLTSPGGDIFGWEKLPKKYTQEFSAEVIKDLDRFPEDWPDLELIPSVFGPPDPVRNFTVFLFALLTTTSAGTVTISSNSIDDNPIVDPHYLSTETDQALAIAAYKRGLELVDAVGYTTGAVAPPLTNDDEILDFLKNTTVPWYHGTGTCRMGKVGDVDSGVVTDTKGRVLGGVRGLRIVDASIFPFPPPAHIMSTVYAVAEKLADDIKNGD